MDTLRTCILSQGSEILTGSIVNTNAQWLSEYFCNTQYTICEHVTVTDDMDALIQTFTRLCEQYDVVISTGGLGPTEDDLTTEAIARFTNTTLVENPQALNMLTTHYHRRNRTVPPPVLKQAIMPTSSALIPNPVGSACGFHISHANTDIYVFPGVPIEMQAMVAQTFTRQYTQQPLIFGTFGASESQILRLLEGLTLPEMAFHATRRAHWLTLYPAPNERERLIQEISNRLSEILFDCADRKRSLVEMVAEHLWARNEMVATAESCTAGKLSSWFTSLPGSSSYYQEGAVVYANEAKHKYCGVSMDLINTRGAVCEQVALDLARGIQERSGATWGIGITGIAGPGGGSVEKPVGTVHIAVYGHGQGHHTHCSFHGTRDQITDQACGQAMFMLFKVLQARST